MLLSHLVPKRVTGRQCRPRSGAQKAVSDQGLHFALTTGISVKHSNSTLDKLLFLGIYPIKIPEKAIQIKFMG